MKILNCFSIVIALSFSAMEGMAQSRDWKSWTSDTLAVGKRTNFQNTIDRITTSRVYQTFYIGAPMIIAGVAVKGESDHFSSLRDEYLPHFRYHYDDYLQYFPAALMLGLKVGGVESRSSWSRMLVSDAFAVAIMAASVNTIKHTAKVLRPDGSNRRSFPSGHTATAFMTATMLTKEYVHKSVWFSVAAYSCATGIGLSRVLNNRHWLSDVMVGAGIGIISTELGYWIGDLIFKEKGLNYESPFWEQEADYRPTFFGIRLGFNFIPGRMHIGGSEVDFYTGSQAGLEGAYFLNPNWGIGGRFSVLRAPMTGNEKPLDDPLDMTSGLVGAYFSYPLTGYWFVGGNLLAGYNYVMKYELSDSSIPAKGGFGSSLGCSFTFHPKPKLSIRFFADYNISQKILPVQGRCFQYYSLGSSAAIAF